MSDFRVKDREWMPVEIVIESPTWLAELREMLGLIANDFNFNNSGYWKNFANELLSSLPEE